MTDNAKKFFVRPWHYAVNRVTAGPVEFATIQQLWNDEEIGPSTLVWQKGSTIGWKKIKKLPDLHQFLTETKQSNMKLRSDNSTASSSRQHSPHALADTRLSRRHQVPLQQSATDLDRSETSRSASPHPLRMREPSSAVIPDGAETDQNWFYVTFDKKSCGPITLMEMREAFQDAKNNLGRETLIWHPEKLGQTWRQAEDVEGVWDYLERKVARRRRGRIGHRTTPNGGFEMAKIRVLQRGMIESRESRGYSTTISEIKHRWLYVDKTLRRRGPVNNKKLTEIWKTSKHLDEHCVVWNMDDPDFSTWRMIKDLPDRYKLIFSGNNADPVFNSVTWHYLNSTSESVGPVSMKQIRELYWNGEINKDTLCWDRESTMTEWLALEFVDEFKQFRVKPKPLPAIPK